MFKVGDRVRWAHQSHSTTWDGTVVEVKNRHHVSVLYEAFTKPQETVLGFLSLIETPEKSDEDLAKKLREAFYAYIEAKKALKDRGYRITFTSDCQVIDKISKTTTKEL